MAPFIARIPVADASGLSASHFGEAVARAGSAFGGAIEQIHRQKELEARQKIEDAQRNRALDIQEQNAQAKLLREQGALQQNAAVKQDALDRLDQMAEANTRDAAAEGVRQSLASPGGVLGPFGIASRAAMGGAQAVAETQQEFAGKRALAEQMTGPAAQAFLVREARDMKVAALKRGYAEEGQALQHALQDGVFEDPATMFERASSGKTPKEVPPSAQAQAEAKRYAEALQSAIAEGRSPGDVHARLAHQYDVHRQIVQRAKAWPLADQRAAELQDTLRKVLAETPNTVDPLTGDNPHADLQERLAQMDGEWARTQYQTFRMGHDPGDSLAGLQKVLFSATAKSAPGAFQQMDQAMVADRQLPKTDVQAVAGAASANARGGDTSGAERNSYETSAGRGTTPPSGGKREGQLQGLAADSAQQKRTAPAMSSEDEKTANAKQRAERESRGMVGRTRDENAPKRKLTSADDKKKLDGLVRDEAQKTLAASGDRKTQMLALRDRIAKDLGLDTSDPRVFSAVKEALSKAYQR
jgi:hypothetical protein